MKRLTGKELSTILSLRYFIRFLINWQVIWEWCSSDRLTFDMKAGKDINIERLLTSILFHHFVSWTKPLSLSGILHLLLTDSSFICISKDPLKRRETDINYRSLCQWSDGLFIAFEKTSLRFFCIFIFSLFLTLLI